MPDEQATYLRRCRQDARDIHVPNYIGWLPPCQGVSARQNKFFRTNNSAYEQRLTSERWRQYRGREKWFARRFLRRYCPHAAPLTVKPRRQGQIISQASIEPTK